MTGEPLRVVLDVNIYVRLVKAKQKERSGTASQRIFAALQTGRLCGRPAQIVASYRMMDTLAGVLRRLSVPEEEAEEFGQAVLAVMKAGPEELSPHIILGGTPDLTLKDTEDGGVLATAFAARAEVLVTDNLKDFATENCETFETTRIRFASGSKRILTCHILRRPDGVEVVVAHIIDFAAWIDETFDPTPENVRKRLSGPLDGAAGSAKKR
jgi:predicted nucleic acid-binding protein